MSEKRYHFQIPKENIKNQKYEKGGGGQTVPRFNHKEHGENIKVQALSLKKNELSKKDAEYTTDIYLQISTPNNYSLKSQKLKIEELGFEILSYSKHNESIGTARIKKDKLSAFEERLEVYINSDENTGKTYFSPIEELSSIPPESKIKTKIDFESEDEIDIVINLFHVLSFKERIAINGAIIKEVSKYTTKEIFRKTFKNGVDSIECKIKSKDIPKVVSEFTTIKEIRPNRLFFVESAMPSDPMPNPLEIRNVESSSNICIIDSGISSANGIFDNLVSYRDLTYLPIGSIDCSYEHGTFVASRLLFGDNIESCTGTHYLQPYCYVIDIPVFGIDKFGQKTFPTEFELSSAIENTVLKHHELIKVYNLSLGVDSPINDNEFSDLAKLLDFLSKEYKVLFVIASGNIRKKLGPFPSGHFGHYGSRIGCPAESILGLTVGSIAKYNNATSLSGINTLSPFSRIGPGADFGIKPEIVAHGGNLIDPYTEIQRISTCGISVDGIRFATDNGTSHAAPLISQFAQRLFDSYPNSDPNLVKALLCHFTETREIHEELTEPSHKYIGFGEPNIYKAIEAGQYNAAYIYEGQLDQENYQYISFHIPQSLSSDKADTKLTIKITITYDPPVNPDNEMEYSMSRISARLFKPNRNEMTGINLSGELNYNLPWNPIIRFEKTFSRSYLTGEWNLRLRLYTRGNIGDSYLQDYSVVIEIIDSENSTNVYEDILNEFGKIYQKIKIKIAA